MRQRKTYISLLIIALQLAALTSCSDELYGGGNGGDGRAVKLKLGYKQSVPAEVVSTRSAATDAENMLKNLQVFIFNQDGKLRGYKWLEHGATDDAGNTISLNQTGSVGTVSIKTVSGNCYIYGVANVTSEESSSYYIDKGIIPTSAEEAAELKWTDDEVTTGGNDLTIDKLKSIAFQRNTDLGIYSTFIMSGVMNDGNLCKIDDSGNLTTLTTAGEANTASDADIIKLRRIVSKIAVNLYEGTGCVMADGANTPLYTDTVKTYNNDGSVNSKKIKYYADAGHITEYTGNHKDLDISFKPTSCDIVNIPKKGVLIEGGTAVENGDNTFESCTAMFYKTSLSGVERDSYAASGYYLPENVEGMSAKNLVGSWEEREADNGGDDNDYTEKYFTNAPEHGTYLKITGSYTETLQNSDDIITEGTPTYYIHLGDFGEDKTPQWSNFKVERNCNYTYNITVNGVKSIKAEVKKDDGDQTNGAVEGIAISLQDDSEIFDLDSHYGQVNMEFDNTCVLSDNGKYYVYFFSKDIRCATPVLKISKDSASDDLTVEKQNGVDEDGNVQWKSIDNTEVKKIENSIDWLEFVDGTGSDGLGAAYPGKNSEKLKSLFDVIGELINEKITNDDDATWTKSYTCFVNENYYDDEKDADLNERAWQWSDFVNQTPRYAYICRDLIASHDLRTIAGAVIYGIKQKSIQTFYNLEDAATVNAYGVETDPDDISDLRSSNAFTYSENNVSLKGKYGLKAANGDGQRIQGNNDDFSTDKWDGYSNFYDRVITKGNVTQWSQLKHTHFSSARYSCMSRNRDLDGDGNIDDDEIRWYPPTVEQYRGLYIGEYALDSDARLFKGNTADLGAYNANKSAYDRVAPAYHYWSSTGYDQSKNYMFWSEGAGTDSHEPSGRNATNKNATYDKAPWGVACVRNLPKNAGSGMTPAEKVKAMPTQYYIWNSDKHKVDLTDMNTNSVRATSIDGELSPHAERGSTSYINKPAKYFYIANNNTTDQSASEDAIKTDKTICASYSEKDDGSDKGTWRAPNLMELELISNCIGSSELTGGTGYINCRTHYSNTDFRCSWCINLNSGQLTASDFGSTNQNSRTKMYMRCVRDATK